jgi:hypothetical protein
VAIYTRRGTPPYKIPPGGVRWSPRTFFLSPRAGMAQRDAGGYQARSLTRLDLHQNRRRDHRD